MTNFPQQWTDECWGLFNVLQKEMLDKGRGLMLDVVNVDMVGIDDSNEWS